MNVLTGGTRSGTTTVVATLASTEKDREVYYLAGHTVKAPRILIFTRSIPSGGSDKEVLKYGVKAVFGDRNSDGTAKSGNIIGSFTLSVPQDQTAALAKELVASMWGQLSNSSVSDAAIDQGLLPGA
jgi:hypothetical protein